MCKLDINNHLHRPFIKSLSKKLGIRKQFLKRRAKYFGYLVTQSEGTLLKNTLNALKESFEIFLPMSWHEALQHASAPPEKNTKTWGRIIEDESWDDFLAV